MEISAILFTLAVLILVGMYLYAPFVRGYGRRVTEEERELSALMAERERVLSSLQELDFDFKLGKIPEEEYPLQRTNLLQKGADVLRKMDELTVGNDSMPSRDLHSEGLGAKNKKKSSRQVKINDDELEAMISARRKVRKSKFDGFCPKCGKPVIADDRFCPSCGKSLK